MARLELAIANTFIPMLAQNATSGTISIIIVSPNRSNGDMRIEWQTLAASFYTHATKKYNVSRDLDDQSKAQHEVMVILARMLSSRLLSFI